MADGISTVLNIDVANGIIEKRTNTESQTKKGRFGRWDNLNNTFIIRKSLKNFKHVVVVDDVVTTGATMERLILELKANNPDLRVSIVALAIAL